MPTNLGHDAISALKVGHQSVTAGYVGHEQIFPNTTEITSLAWNSNAGLPNYTTSRNLQVAGAVGATYDIVGSNGASSYTGQILNTPTQSDNIAISSNDGCTTASRTVQIVVTPTGNTQLASGVNGTLSLTQAGGPGITYRSVTGSVNVTNTNYVPYTIGSNKYWGAGSSWSVSWSVTSAYGTNGSFYSFVFPGTTSGSTSYSQWNSGSTSASGSFTYTLTYSTGAYAIPFRMSFNRLISCEETSPSSIGTYHYPP